jgi:hypothetical protein
MRQIRSVALSVAAALTASTVVITTHGVLAQGGAAQQPAQPGAQQPGGRGGRGGGRGGPQVPPVAFEDRTGFENMFDGKALNPGELQARAAQEAAQKAAAAQPPAEGGAGAGRGRGRGGGQFSRFRTGTVTRNSGASTMASSSAKARRKKWLARTHSSSGAAAHRATSS